LGSASLGRFRIAVYRSDQTAGIPLKDINQIPRDARLIWAPVHIPVQLAEKGEVALLIAPRGEGKLLALAPHKVKERAEWDLPANAGVIALVMGPNGLNIQKVKTLVANNDELLAQLADYAQQTSQVEALIQGLADSEASGSGADAALQGFSSRYGVAMPKLNSQTTSNQQAALLLSTIMPSANAYDPLSAGASQVQQTTGLAASVAGLFFGSNIGIAAGGTALVGNLKAMLFPNTEFRSAIAQAAFAPSASGVEVPAADTGVLEFCGKNQPSKSRTRLAFLWAYRVPALPLPVTTVAAPAYIPAGAKGIVKLKTADGSNVKDLARVKDWQLVPAGGGAALTAPVTIAADAVQIDLTKTQTPAGDYRLTGRWDWDRASLGTVHIRPYSDFHMAHLTPASQDRLTQGSGVVTVNLTGADFEFVDKVELQKQAARLPAPVATRFDLPEGEGKGEQRTMTVDIDTASAGPYRLLLSQEDGVKHAIPVTVLPPNPKVSNFPLRANLGEPQQKFRLQGNGLERVDAISSDAGTIEGKADGNSWTGKIRLKADVKVGQTFRAVLKVRGVDEPVTVDDAIEVVGPRPKIESVTKSLPGDPGIEMAADELPAGTEVGLVLAVQHLREPDDDRPKVGLGCRAGELRKSMTLSPDDAMKGVSVSFAGPDSLYLSIDPGMVGYPGCELVATVSVDPRGRSDQIAVGRVVRMPQLEKFTLTSEALAADTYAGILRGRDLDLIEKAGWDSRNGLPVAGIPTPVPGDASKQTLRIAVPWPSPAPHAPLYIWLRGEQSGRRTGVSD